MPKRSYLALFTPFIVGTISYMNIDSAATTSPMKSATSYGAEQITSIDFSNYSPQTAKRQNLQLDDTKINELISQMTLEEKIAQLHAEAGDQGMWRTANNTRLNIPGFIMSDGPHGVRFGDSATSFPVGSAMSATWDMPLLERVGTTLGKQFKAFGNNVALGPCIDLQRDPRNGRSPESAGEDPYLADKVGLCNYQKTNNL